jgi:hypothetical protein
MGAWRQDGLADSYIGRNVTLTLTLTWIMYRAVIVIFIYYHHTPIDLMYSLLFIWLRSISLNYRKSYRTYYNIRKHVPCNTVINNAFFSATIDKVFYYVSLVITTCFGPYIRPTSGEFTIIKRKHYSYDGSVVSSNTNYAQQDAKPYNKNYTHLNLPIWGLGKGLIFLMVWVFRYFETTAISFIFNCRDASLHPSASISSSLHNLEFDLQCKHYTICFQVICARTIRNASATAEFRELRLAYIE